MNRPEVKNAINTEMLCRLADAWDMIDGDAEMRCAILTGAGERLLRRAPTSTSSSRASMQSLPPEDEFEERIRADYGVIFNGLLRNRSSKKPLIAAVEGYCVAGGTEILQATDIRVAGEGADVRHHGGEVGPLPAGRLVIRLRRQIPYTKAMEMLLTADMYPAEEALRIRADRPRRAEGPGAGDRRASSPRRSPPTARVAVQKIKEAGASRRSACRRRTRSTIDFQIGMQVTRPRTRARARARSRRSARRIQGK